MLKTPPFFFFERNGEDRLGEGVVYVYVFVLGEKGVVMEIKRV